MNWRMDRQNNSQQTLLSVSWMLNKEWYLQMVENPNNFLILWLDDPIFKDLSEKIPGIEYKELCVNSLYSVV